MKNSTRNLLILMLVVFALISVFALCSCENDEYTPNLFVEYDYNHDVYYGDALDTLKPFLTVTYYSERGELTKVDDYSISGNLQVGSSKITVKYNDITATVAIYVLPKQDENPNQDEEPVVEYTVKFVAGNLTVSTQKYTADNKNIVEPEVPARNGYNGVWEDYTLTAGDVTVNAVYSPKQYTVTLDYDGATEGNAQQTITTTYFEPVGYLPIPVKTGYIFTGWYIDDLSVYSTSWWTIDNDSATLTAHWRDMSVSTQGLQYTLNRDGETYTLSGLGDATDTDIVIPSTYNGKPVTSIGTHAFFYGKNTTSVTIPDSVTNIGPQAFFGCKNLVSVAMPNSINTISVQAFAYCEKLINITIPDNVKYIENSAFDDCSSLTSIAIPDSVMYIGSNAFHGCGNLTSIVVGESNTAYHSDGNCLIETESKTLLRGCQNSVIPTDGSVTSIAYAAFNDCNGLTSIIIPNSVTSIESNAFANCINLTSVILPDGITSIKGSMFKECRSLKSITIPDSVTSIDWQAFYNCYALTDVVIPNSVESVSRLVFYNCINLKYNQFDNIDYLGNSENPYLVAIKATVKDIVRCEINSNTKIIVDDAFFDCDNLTSVVIPASVIYVGYSAFASCSSLTSIDVDKANTVYHSDGNCLIETASKTILLGCNNSVIPTDGSVTTIGGYAFSGSGVTSITIPSNIASIGWQAFFQCNSLTNVTICDGVESIGGAAFYGCSSLTSIIIPDSVTSIDESAFSDCSSLTSVTIGKGVTSIGYWAFTRCPNLINIVVDEANTVYHSDGNCLIETASKTLLRGGQNSVIPTDGSVTTIDNSAFAGCSDMTNIIIPDTITKIFGWSFSDCTSLTSVIIPSSVTYIDNSTFHSCTSLTRIEFDGTVEQWNNVYQGAGWNYLVPATKVICSDGEVKLK